MRDPGDAPQRAVRTLALTTLQQIGLTMVRFGLPVLVPFVRDDLRLSLVQAGILLAALDVGGLAAFIPTGIVADRWGERRVLVAGGVLMGAAAALAALAPTYGFLLAGLTLAGTGFPSGHTAGSKMIVRQFPARSRGLAIGVRQAGLPVGGAIAALWIPALASLGGWRLSLAAVGAACAVFGLWCLALPREENLPGAAGAAALPTLAFDRDFWLVSLMASTLVVGQFTLQGYLPLFLVDEHRWAPSAAGRLLVFVHAGGVVGRLLWGTVSDRLAGGRRKPVLTWVIVGGALILVALSRFPAGAGAWLAGVVAFVGGTFLVGWNGLAVALIVERVGAAHAATALGVALTVLFLGTIGGTPLFGWIVEQSGAYAPAWLFVAACQVAAWASLSTARERVSPSG